MHIVVPLEINGKLYRVKLTVKDLEQGVDKRKLLHALESAEIESAPLGTLPNSPLGGVGTTQPTTERIVSISQLLKNATDEDGKPFRL